MPTPATALLRPWPGLSPFQHRRPIRSAGAPRNAEFFLQDDWRVTRHLTVNLGVRYTLNFPSTVANDQGAVFNLQTQKLDYLGQNGFPRNARTLAKDNFGPRIGLAYKLAD